MSVESTDLSAIATKHIAEVFSRKAAILMPDEQDKLVVPVAGVETFLLDEQD